MKVHFRIVAVLAVVSLLLLTACGPPPNPKLTGKSEETPKEEVQTEESAPVEPAEAPAVVPAPAPPKPMKVVPADPPVRRQAAPPPQTADVARPAPEPVTPPAAIAAAREPADEVRPARVEPPAPPPPPPAPVARQVRVPSGTIIALRMIDSIDSDTAVVGDTFKASLDEAVVVDRETVFPQGTEAYVKLAKVESAGRVSGKSEVQVQLDRIVLNRRSYLVESNTYVQTGEGQGGRTARSAGIGAAIGATIGAVTGGKKGAIIGGATGAGAGAGVEAVRKGEQVRIESEARLDFRLEDSIDVTLQPSSSNTPQRNNPSGPSRLGTRQ